jgi:methylglyoxal synthase
VAFKHGRQPHDVKALTRLAIVYDLPRACGPATADLVIASPLFAPVGPGTN